MSKTKPKIVILTGAGISSEAGIKTFRDDSGPWEGHKIEEVATYTGFIKSPSLVYGFYNERRSQLLEESIKPTIAHTALTKLEKAFQGRSTIITQNVDNLHERAESDNVLHMHGELLKMKCLQSNKTFPILNDLTTETTCTCCKQPSRLRPDIVWFGETPYFLERITDLLAETDYFIAIGTSAQVYPAAMFINMVPKNCVTIEINTQKTAASWRFKDNYLGSASIEVPKLVDHLISKLC